MTDLASRLWLDKVPAWDDGRALIVIETPKDSPNKLKFDPDLGAFRLSKVLPVGTVFPYDFGFLPGTHAPDGDPLDVLILIDAPLYPGCIVPSTLIGVLECDQRERDGTVERSDRLLAVAEASTVHAGTSTIRDLSPAVLSGIEAFFADYNRLAGKEFRVLRRRGRRAAEQAARRAPGAARAGPRRRRGGAWRGPGGAADDGPPGGFAAGPCYPLPRRRALAAAPMRRPTGVPRSGVAQW